LDIDPDAQDAGEKLRRMPAAPLIAKQMVLAAELSSFGVAVPAFTPCADEGRPFDPERIARTIAARKIAMIIGTTREEMHAFYAGNPAMRDPDPAAVAAWFEKLTGRAETIDTYARHRPGATRLDLFGDLMTDHQFLLGSLDLARRVRSNNGTAFVYQFDWSGPDSPWKACHTIELPFTFGTLPAWDAPMLRGLDQATYSSLSGTMMAAWCEFAQGGDPSLPNLAWPQYGPGRETMCFGPIVGVMGDPAGVGWKIGGGSRR
jgi:para-nitrobenzyl esterase